MNRSVVAIIPARYASTRLPGKPLLEIAGRPMILHVVDRAREVSFIHRVIVATDDERVLRAVRDAGAEAIMTASDHASGTDRLAEVAAQLDAEIIVNVQGDEPLIDPALIRAVASVLGTNADAAMATAAHPIVDAAEFFNPNVVKVVCDANGFAHYFSRAPIPYARDAFAQKKDALPAHFPALRHIGLYAYRAGFLKRYASLPPAPAEQLESLEQLRALHHGYRIAVTVWPGALAPGVDTLEDLEKVRARFTVT